MTIIAAYVLNVHAPDVEDHATDPLLADQRLLADLPAMLEAAEEDLQDLMPEGYTVTIKEWSSDE